MKRCLLFLFGYLLTGILFAIDPEVEIRLYNQEIWWTRDGLPQNTVYSIVQTTDGYLWVATQEGLGRFDGVRFLVYDRLNTPQLGSNYITALHEDKAGRLWIGTIDGNLLCMKNGKISKETWPRPSRTARIWMITSDSRHNLWIATGAGLCRKSAGSSHFRFFTTAQGLSSNDVRAVCVQQDGTVWAGTRSGLNRIRKEKVDVYSTSDGLPNDYIRSVVCGKGGDIWIGTRMGLVQRRQDQFEFPDHPGLKKMDVTALFTDRNGALWIGTEGSGVLRLYNGQISIHTTRTGLSSNIILAFCEDREGNLWIGAGGGGLVRLTRSKFTSYTTLQGLSSNPVWTVAGGLDGSMWMGTFDGGLNRLHQGKFTFYDTEHGLTSNRIYSIYIDPKGRVWVGTAGGGVNILQDDSIQVLDTTKGLPSNDIRVVYGTRDGTIWLGTESDGLCKYREGKIDCYDTEAGLLSNEIRCLLESADGGLWIGTAADGLNRLDKERFTSFTAQQGLSSNRIQSLYEDEAGVLWIGTRGGGLNRWNGEKFVSYHSGIGLFDNSVFHVMEDASGYLWMTCNKGVFRVRKTELEDYALGKIRKIHSESFGTAEGMKSNECNSGQPGGWKTPDGEFWFPTIQGVAVIHPEKIPVNRVIPPVHIEEVITNLGNLDPSQPARIPSGMRTIEFHYTALSLQQPQKVRFQYKLEGFDPDWIDAGTRRVAYYTNIPPGEYVFAVKACNNDGVWNEAGARFFFVLQPRFYQTLWFYSFLTVFLVSSGAGIYSFRINQLKKREAELVRLVEQRTSQLEEANRKLLQLSLLDPLTGISNRRHFEETLQVEWRRAMRSSISLCLMVMDIDFFKAYNDEYGHQSGDETLKKVAAEMSATFRRAGDLVARYGGEEFVAILPAMDLETAAGLAEELRKRVEALAIPHRKSTTSPVVTISIGVAAAVPGNYLTPERLLAAADQALYRAKQTGRNRVCTWINV